MGFADLRPRGYRYDAAKQSHQLKAYRPAFEDIKAVADMQGIKLVGDCLTYNDKGTVRVPVAALWKAVNDYGGYEQVTTSLKALVLICRVTHLLSVPACLLLAGLVLLSSSNAIHSTRGVSSTGHKEAGVASSC